MLNLLPHYEEATIGTNDAIIASIDLIVVDTNRLWWIVVNPGSPGKGIKRPGAAIVHAHDFSSVTKPPVQHALAFDCALTTVPGLLRMNPITHRVYVLAGSKISPHPGVVG
jgi:hypothetical protein